MRTKTQKTISTPTPTKADLTLSLAPGAIVPIDVMDALGRAGQVEETATKDARGQVQTVLSFALQGRQDKDTVEQLLAPWTDPDPVDPTEMLVLFLDPPDETLSPSDVTIAGTNGDDVIVGSALNESILAFDGEDLVHGGDGDDIISAHDGGGDSLYGDAGNDWLTAWNEDENYLDGGTGDDRLLSFRGDDQFFGGTGNDEVFSHGGNNTMHGEAGNDELVGGGDEDLLFGGEGNDYVNGADGQDTLTGGADEDVFGFYAVYMDHKDTVTDFVIGEDRIDVFDLHNMDLAPGETLGDAMVVLDVAGGADVMALTTLHGWEVFAHFQGVDAMALQSAIDDGSVFYEYGSPGTASPIIGAQPFDFL